MINMFWKRVPTVLQMEAAECGAASLCMILGYYGRYVDLSDMRRECHVSRDGSRLSYVMAAAKKYGLEADARRKDADLEGITLPAIVFWRFCHFLVVEKITDKKVYLSDPAKGKVILTKEEFAADYSGVVLQLTKTETFEKGGVPFSSNKILINLLKGKKSVFVYLGILILLLNLVGLVIPGLTSLFIDFYLPILKYTSLTSFFAVFALLLVVQAVLGYLRMRVILRFERKQSAMINGDMIRKLLELPMQFFQTRSHTTMVSRLSTIDKLSEFLAGSIVPVVMGLVFTVIYFLLLMYYSVQIGILVAVIIAILVVLLLLLVSISKNLVLSQTNEMAGFYSNTVQNFKLFDTIKASALEEQAIDNSIKTFIEYENASQRSNKILALIQAIPMAVPLLIQTITVVMGCVLVVEQKMTVGAVLACQSISMSIFAPIADLIAQYSAFQSMDSDIRGLQDIASEESDPIANRINEKEEGCMTGKIELKDVSFGYNPVLPPVVKNINLHIEPGKSLALVGGSGSGKTTILRLLEGLYIPSCGEILFDDIPIMKTSREAMAKSIAIISQKAALFAGTVRENITLFDNSISSREIEQAAKDACIYEDIESKGNGFNEYIDVNACKFSGGQVQRIMIARALVRNPKILIMDEATSALDPIVEEEIMKNIRNRKITTIIVAHRLSTIRDCDEIAVLKNGTIVERGSHDELMAPGHEVYRSLVLAEDPS